jgi:excisionase family DNA binding protein
VHVRALLTTQEAAETLAISKSKLAMLIASGEIDSIRVGRSRRVPVDAITKFVDERREGRAPNKDGIS